MHTKQNPGVAFEHLNYKNVSDTVDTLLLSLDNEKYKDLRTRMIKFIELNMDIFNNLKESYKCIEFHDASKERSTCFIAIVTTMVARMAVNPEDLLDITVDDKGRFSNISLNNEILYSWEEFYPRTYRVLVNALPCLNKAESLEERLSLLHAMISVTTIFNDLRFSSRATITKEETRIKRDVFDNVPDYRMYNEYLKDDINTFVSKLVRGELKVTNPHLREHINDVHNAIKRTLNVRDIRDIQNPPFISMASTGMYDKERKVRLPALLADPYERIPEVIRDIPCYGTTIIKEPNNTLIRKGINDDGKDTYGKFITIGQSKLKRRGIHISPNYLQDRLSYYHNLFASILRKIKRDCTFEQHKGYNKVTSWTDILEQLLAVLSLDLTAATDTWLIKTQMNVMYQILKEFTTVEIATEMVKDWETLMQFPELVGTKLDAMLCGQPQGRLSSFPVFAFCHHIIVLFTEYQLYIEGILKDQFIDYVILGDDSSNCSDSNQLSLEYKARYIFNFKCCGVDCNPNKGYTSMIGEPKVAEFAKVLAIEGHNFSPSPLGILMSGNKLEYWVWWLYYAPYENIHILVKNLSEMYDYDSDALMIYIASLTDYKRIAHNKKALYNDFYTEQEFRKVGWFHDTWMFKDSILVNMLESSDRLDLGLVDSYTDLKSKITKRAKELETYCGDNSIKLNYVYDMELMKNFVIGEVYDNLDIPDEVDRYLNFCLSALRISSQDIIDSLEDVLNILDTDPETYVRSLSYQKVIDSLRGRSFNKEAYFTSSTKVKELITELTVDNNEEETDEFLLFEF